MSWTVLIGDDQLSPRVTAHWAGLKPGQVATRAAAHASPGEIVTVSDPDRGVRREFVALAPEGATGRVRPAGRGVQAAITGCILVSPGPARFALRHLFVSARQRLTVTGDH